MWTSHSYDVKTPLVDGWIHHEFIREIQVCLAQRAGGQAGGLPFFIFP
jgi:hypothetical protein